ncbi:MAG: quinone oxidoreductase [Anaerolineales bacterium]|nr:quinone oxidoreductase [Anaerolineales bacterium]
MKAIQIYEVGGPEALQYSDVPVPDPGEGEVRIKVAAVGINFIDIYHRKGLYPIQAPFTPGSEASGVVDALGPGVETFREGDRVAYAMVRGSYSEYVTVPAAKLVHVPADIDLRLAAAAMLQGLTTHYLVMSTYPVSQDDTALVYAAAGGVGHMLIQAIRHLGGRVIAVTSTEEKAALVRANGVEDIILYTQTDLVEETLRMTGAKGVDVVYESVGKTTFEKSLNCLRPRGMLVLYGQSSGPVPPLDPQELNRKGSLFLTRPTLGHYMQTPEELNWRAGDLFEWIRSGVLEIRIDQEYPLSEAAEAHRYLEGGLSKGKLLLIP